MTTFLRRLRRHRSGTAVLEFALGAPLLMTAGLYGVETANQAIVQMRINQIAMLVADNSARIGENSLLGDAKIYESDIDDVLYGAKLQGTQSFDFYSHGRIILSSLEVVPDTTSNQYIHWQRCMGALNYQSTYGSAGDGLSSPFSGMGPSGQEITAAQGEAVMFVEVAYDYQPLVSSVFSSAGTLTATAAFNVRDNRDLTQIYQQNPSQPSPVATCDKYQTIGQFYGT